MKNILFTVVLGCFIASGLAAHDTFQFTDAQGRCWSCSPGSPCAPCNTVNHPWIQPNAIEDYPNTCPPPDCSIEANRAILFPVNGDPTGYLQCVNLGTSWSPVQVDCQCSTFFDFVAQSCQSVWDWQPHCLITGPIPDPIPCEDPTTEPATTEPATTEPATTEPATTEPATTAPPCQPCMPCMPCMIWWMCMPCNNQCNNPCSNMG